MQRPSPVQECNVLYLEDLRIGDRFFTETHALDEQQIVAFARQYDPQPFHIDDNAAQATLFGGLAASGWHTAAITMRLLVTSQSQFAGGFIGAGVELEWPTPTRPGDILQVESEIVDVAPSRTRADRGMVTLSAQTRNQRGEIVQRMRARLVVLSRAGAFRATQGG